MALALGAALVLTCPGVSAASTATGPKAAPPRTVAGPGSQVTKLSGLSIARDGTGGLVYLGQSGGVEHVFVSRLTRGVFQPPEQVDAGLSGASSQPALAAGNTGVLVVAFTNSGNLYSTQVTGSSSAWSAPRVMHTGAQYPSLQMTNYGKAYLAFTATAASGHDVMAAYWQNGVWEAATGPFNVNPGDDAGTGSGRPVVAAATDGVGIVAWGENGHVYARRMWATSPSVADEQLDPSSFGGATESSAGDPVISVGGDSSYPDIAFEEKLTSTAGTWNRVLMTRLVAEDVGSTVAIDGLSSSTPGNAGYPAVAQGEYGVGWAVASDLSSGQLIGTPLAQPGLPGSPRAISSGSSTGALLGAPAVAATKSTLIAWEQSPMPGQPEVFLRYGSGGTTLGSTQTLSSPGAQLQAADGLMAAGDHGGDAAVAWIQGQSGSLSLEAAQLYQPPPAPELAHRFGYQRTARPRLRWSASKTAWGLSFQVTLDGRSIARTSHTSIRVGDPVRNGPHRWKVTAVNPAAQRASGPTATVFVDTVAPKVSFTVSGRLRRGRPVSLHIRAVDQPAAQHGAKASGLASVRVTWGDGSGALHAQDISDARHSYSRKGVFRIAVRATDRAGNTTTVARNVRIGK